MRVFIEEKIKLRKLKLIELSLERTNNQSNGLSDPNSDDNELKFIDKETSDETQLNDKILSYPIQQPSSVEVDLTQYLHLSNTPMSAPRIISMLQH